MTRTINLDTFLLYGVALVFVIAAVWLSLNTLAGLQRQIDSLDTEIKALQTLDPRSLCPIPIERLTV